MRAEGVLQRFKTVGALGAAAQPVVPGIYAWAVSVAPAAFDTRWDRLQLWAHGSSGVARLAVLVAPAWLLAAPAIERRWPASGRAIALWGFVLTCALAWSAAPASVASSRFDAGRGVAAMIGWALFAVASAAPSAAGEGRHDAGEDQGAIGASALRPRRGAGPRGDALYLAGGALLMAILQGFGWRVAVAERALLVRLVSLAAGLAVMGAAADLAVARHGKRASAVHSVSPPPCSPGAPRGAQAPGPHGCDLRPALVAWGFDAARRRGFAVALVIVAVVAMAFGESALARAEDLQALYWLVVGVCVVALYAAVQIARPAAKA